MDDLQKSDNAVFWQGLQTGMALASSVTLAAFGAAAVFVTGLALATGAPLIAGLVTATPLVSGAILLGGTGLLWGGIKRVLTTARQDAVPPELPPPSLASSGFGASLKKGFAKGFSRKPSLSGGPKPPKHHLG